jgi:hypothetical protein
MLGRVPKYTLAWADLHLQQMGFTDTGPPSTFARIFQGRAGAQSL